MKWKLVPTELTEEMNVAGMFAASQMRGMTGRGWLKERRKAIYRAQIAASPTPPTHYEVQPDGTITPADPADMGTGAIPPSSAGLRKAAEEVLKEWEAYGGISEEAKNNLTALIHADDGLIKAAKKLVEYFKPGPKPVFAELIHRVRNLQTELEKLK